MSGSFCCLWNVGRRPVCRADNLTTFMCRLSWNLGASTSWNPQGLCRPVMGLLCLFYLYSLFLSAVFNDTICYRGCIAMVIDERMILECWYNDTDRGELNCSALWGQQLTSWYMTQSLPLLSLLMVIWDVDCQQAVGCWRWYMLWQQLCVCVCVCIVCCVGVWELCNLNHLSECKTFHSVWFVEHHIRIV